jgi:hypothetical protein
MADGLLPYLFSRSNAFRRNLMDMVSNPADYAAKMGGQVVDTGNELAELQERSGMFGAGPVDEAARDELYQRAADAAMNMTGMIRMSHGSPHLFSKFDFGPKKIGTGEGAQAYGHGGYLAEGFDSPVAKAYTPRDFDYESELMKLYKNAERRRDYDSLDVLESAMMHSTPAELRAQFGKSAEPLIRQIESIPITSGRLYNVEAKWPDAAREARDPLGKQHFLNWDKPLSEQSPQVIRLARQYNLNDPDHLGGDLVAAADAKRRAGAAQLQQAGIPGITYLDSGSRGAGQGTSNYVIFPGNESLLEIIQRTGAQ